MTTTQTDAERSAEALKDCPFCGAKPIVRNGGPGNYYVRCLTCHACGDDGSKERAIAAWNRRTPDPAQLQADNERLAGERDALAETLDPGTAPELVSRIIMTSIENGVRAEAAEKRADTLQRQLDAANSEIDNLKHDLERHVAIATDLVNEPADAAGGQEAVAKLHTLHAAEHAKLGQMLLDKTPDGVSDANWQGGKVNGIGAAIMELASAPPLSAAVKVEVKPLEWFDTSIALMEYHAECDADGRWRYSVSGRDGNYELKRYGVDCGSFTSVADAKAEAHEGHSRCISSQIALSAPAAAGVTVPADATRDVLAERRRQVEAEGWTPEHDDEHNSGEMAIAASAYAMSAAASSGTCTADPVGFWPWDIDWWKPSDRRRDLVKSGALILAEIERLDRAAANGGA